MEFLAKSTDIAVLKSGLEAKGYRVTERGKMLAFRDDQYRDGTYNAATGELKIDEEMDGNSIKQAYSEEIVMSQARAFDWQVEWTTNAQGEREALVQRRG
ncbi:MAG: hypothetical protein ACRDQZ_11830 [Mycobacteriales bacterium]